MSDWIKKLTMLAHFFLWHRNLHMGKKAPVLTLSQLRRLLDAVLPLRTVTVNSVLESVARIQRRNHSAHLARRKRRETEG